MEGQNGRGREQCHELYAKRKVEVMDLQTEKLKEELDVERVKMDEEWEERRQKQKLIGDIMTVVRKGRVASIDGE